MIRNTEPFSRKAKEYTPVNLPTFVENTVVTNQVFMPVCADSVRSKEYQLIKLRSLAVGSYTGLNKRSLPSFMILTVLNVSSLGHS